MADDVSLSTFGLRALIVTQDDKMSRDLCAFLGPRGVAAVASTSAESAAQVVSTQHPDVVLLEAEVRDHELVLGAIAALADSPLLIAIDTYDTSVVYEPVARRLIKPFRGRQIVGALAAVGQLRMAAQRESPSAAVNERADAQALSRPDVDPADLPPSDETAAHGPPNEPPPPRQSPAPRPVSSGGHRVAAAAKPAPPPSSRPKLIGPVSRSVLGAAPKQQARPPVIARSRDQAAESDFDMAALIGTPSTPPPGRAPTPKSTPSAPRVRDHLLAAADEKTRKRAPRSLAARAAMSNAAAVPLRPLDAGPRPLLADWDLTPCSVSPRGSLTSDTLPTLLHQLFASGQSGMLRLAIGDQDRRIYFLHGEPIFASTVSSQDLLGAVLVNLGMLSLEKLSDVLDALVPGQVLGEVLVSSGQITPEQLLGALERQIFERIVANFTARTGKYTFEVGDSWGDEVQVFRQNPLDIIREGIEKHVSPNRIAELLSPSLSKYIVQTPLYVPFLEHWPTRPFDDELLPLIDGRSTLQDLSVAAKHDVFDLLRLVWTLRAAGMVTFAETAAESTPVPPRRRDIESPSATATPDPVPVRTPVNPGVPGGNDLAPVAVSSGSMPDLEALSSIERNVAVYLARLATEDHFTLLGVPRDADKLVLRKAFKAGLAAVPPEHVHHLPDGVREKADEVLAALRKAYDTLAAPGGAEEYKSRVSSRRRKKIRPTRARRISQTPEPPQPPVSRLLPSRMFDSSSDAGQNVVGMQLARARAAAEEHQWKSAYRFIKQAADIDGQNPEVIALQAWIIFNLPSDDPERKYRICVERLELAVSMDPSLADSHLYLALVLEQGSELVDAVRRYESVIELQPEHAEAQRALKRLAAVVRDQEDGGDGGSGVFDRLKGWLDK